VIAAVFFLLASQVHDVRTVPVPPPPTPPTIESRTTPAFDLDCSLVDASLTDYELAIEQRGGRGYIDPRIDHPERRFASTPLTFSVIRDSTGLFSADRLMGVNDGYQVRRIEGGHPQFGSVRLETFQAGSGRLAALVYINALAEVRLTGFCAVTRHQQTPLTAAEVAEVLGQ
jgi:hypothetical protein